VKKIKDILLIIVSIVMLGILGCSSLLDEVTPAVVGDRSLDYAEKARTEIGFPTLADVRRIKTDIIINHRDKQIDLKRVAEDDTRAYGDALQFINASIAEAQYVQNLVVGSEGNPISILGLLAPLGIGAALGRRYFKRPGDLTPEEVKTLKG